MCLVINSRVSNKGTSCKLAPAKGNFHQEITNKWNIYFKNNSNLKKSDIVAFAKKIDDEFGHLFLPPTR